VIQRVMAYLTTIAPSLRKVAPKKVSESTSFATQPLLPHYLLVTGAH
jgi:hypothetical protein